MIFSVEICAFGNELKELRILGLQAITGDAFPGGPTCLVAVKMALDSINQHPSLLNGYNLTYDYVDHEVRDERWLLENFGCIYLYVVQQLLTDVK